MTGFVAYAYTLNSFLCFQSQHPSAVLAEPVLARSLWVIRESASRDAHRVPPSIGVGQLAYCAVDDGADLSIGMLCKAFGSGIAGKHVLDVHAVFLGKQRPCRYRIEVMCHEGGCLFGFPGDQLVE